MESVHATSSRVNKYNYVCGVCRMVFVSGKALGCHQKRHLKTHAAFECCVCHTPFTNRCNLTRHQKRSHPKQSGGGPVLIAPTVEARALNGACRVGFLKCISGWVSLIFICFYIQVLSWVVQGMDARVVLEQQKDNVLAVVVPPQKWYLVLRVEMVRRGVLMIFGFRSNVLVVMEPTSLAGQYDRAKDDVLENIETFEDMGPGWVVSSVNKLELHTVKYMPL